MATAAQTEHAVAPTGTTIIPGAGNDEIEDSIVRIPWSLALVVAVARGRTPWMIHPGGF